MRASTYQRTAEFLIPPDDQAALGAARGGDVTL